ncbi:MAG: cell division protein FtsA [Candidatus Zambryskibacteria bacterium RIFCSPHIGHO2_01_FULL_43_25]|uniref:Cell division protein FtsA n=1 Tax=Candidatus Zambryskibacteria bacterium RIFCSPLOWO2_01_FULL_45_21 TaxID=1802761 RepID=A0A1G2U0A2_9BACT|nr:MAG: cell division protein FtsA [Candidatus Zambryskibacteria bacterium RIFCSPHIGHO2_01_FULL_43_25]OHB00939.1 MAG: cell division protein FtsA [Candidatus Zambryskibacteria bacterium RIFCSPHIGHO2_12_FULL_44_12b]OHB02967.1 MAG: cell division protein FtsA [Candidatus Zambryskibacteria bacterium RIFCSPLOWO2_01_FULL_45_21]
MARNIAIGIDIGTYQIKVVAAEHLQGDKMRPKVLGTGFAESRGLRHGYIVNVSEVTRSLKNALAQVEKTSQLPIKKAYISVGGIGISSTVSQGSALISRADSEITELDLSKVMEACENSIPASLTQNRRVIHRIPLQYKIDGKLSLGDPVGMKGMKLEIKAMFVTCLEQHLKSLIEAVEETGVEVIAEVASPIAAAHVTLTKAQKIAGCVLANIGSETLSIVVFENDIPTSLEVFPIGSTDITKDIALGLRIPLEEAESIKHGSITATSFPKKKLDEIVAARLSDMFELIEAHLKKIGRNGLLPAGIIITGGGSSIVDIAEIAKSSLRLPSRVAHINFPDKGSARFDDTLFAVAYGLCILGLTQDLDDGEGMLGGFIRGKGGAFGGIKSWIKQFLP